ncbi:MAG: hypothetical protein NVSMB67_09320 [Flavisolibacter sp.]
MKYYKFYIHILSLFLFVSSHLYAQKIKDSLLSELSIKWANAKDYSLKIAELMPETEYNFKPVQDEMSFKEQLLHIRDNILWLSLSYLLVKGSNEKKDLKNMSKVDVIKSLRNAYDEGLKAHNISSDQLNEIVNFFAGPKTKRQILILMHDHQAHHVGQLIVYLRLKGIKPPEYIGW